MIEEILTIIKDGKYTAILNIPSAPFLIISFTNENDQILAEGNNEDIWINLQTDKKDN